MNQVLSILYDFLLIFIIILIVYFVFFNKRRKEYSQLQDNDIIKNFIVRYNLDMRKTNYKSVLYAISIINSFIMAVGAIIVLKVKGMVWNILIAFVVIVILIYSLYEITGRYFKKKEDSKNV